jgi:prophage tail gpP-like protein
MSDKKYTVQQDDTFSRIASLFYGDPKRADEIFQYNRARIKSGTITTIYPGEEILIPLDDRKQQSDTVFTPADFDNDEVSIEIAGQKLIDWQSVTVTRNIDTPADGFELGLSTTGKLPDNIKPFGYEKCKIAIGKDKILTGRIIKPTPDLSDSNLSLSLVGHSLAGQLLTVSITQRPFEFNNQNLEEIANIVVKPFGIRVVFQDGPGNDFTKAVARHGETVFSFLNKLASQRGLLISSTVTGNLIFWRGSTAAPVAFLEEGKQILRITPTFDGDVRYSDIMIEAQQKGGAGPLQSKITDSIVKDAGINRPLVTRPNETPEGLDLDDIAKWERGKRSAESMPVTLTVQGWRKPDGGVWQENENINLLAPSVWFLKKTKMLIRQVAYTLNDNQKNTVLSVVLPSAYSLTDEEVRPWLA